MRLFQTRYDQRPLVTFVRRRGVGGPSLCVYVLCALSLEATRIGSAVNFCAQARWFRAYIMLEGVETCMFSNSVRSRGHFSFMRRRAG